VIRVGPRCAESDWEDGSSGRHGQAKGDEEQLMMQHWHTESLWGEYREDPCTFKTTVP